MSKHTPGPWIANVETVTDLRGRIIADCGIHLGVTENENRPNTSLIAAAPELLRAAQASKQLLVTLYPIFESIDKASTNTDYANGMKAIIGALKLVIEKAEGRE